MRAPEDVRPVLRVGEDLLRRSLEEARQACDAPLIAYCEAAERVWDRIIGALTRARETGGSDLFVLWADNGRDIALMIRLERRLTSKKRLDAWTKAWNAVVILTRRLFEDAAAKWHDLRECLEKQEAQGEAQGELGGQGYDRQSIY